MLKSGSQGNNNTGNDPNPKKRQQNQQTELYDTLLSRTSDHTMSIVFTVQAWSPSLVSDHTLSIVFRYGVQSLFQTTQ